MRVKHGVSLLEVAMAFIILLIIAVVALPTLGLQGNENTTSDVVITVSTQKVKTAYAFAMAENGDYPQLNQIVDFIDADFASENNESTGIIFRDGQDRLTVKTYRDIQCKLLTNSKKPGVSDIVRCI